eukprot:6190574-Pleurochrysis_carterae.AAC.4
MQRRSLRATLLLRSTSSSVDCALRAAAAAALCVQRLWVRSASSGVDALCKQRLRRTAMSTAATHFAGKNANGGDALCEQDNKTHCDSLSNDEQHE